MQDHAHTHNFAVQREWTVKPWDLFTSTQTYHEFANNGYVSETRMTFLLAACGFDEEEAAKWHSWGIRGLPGAKYHAMLGQVENNADIRRLRAERQSIRNNTLGRPDYYSSFDVH